MKIPYISIIMPAYNAAPFIGAAVESVLNQTFDDFELIIIDDCSKDETPAIIRSYALRDTRIIFLRNPENVGVSKTRNYGIAQARGEWIAFLDSDDMWRPDKLEKQINLLDEHPEVQISYTASSFIDYAGNPFNYVLPAEAKTTYRTLLRMNLMSCSSVMVRKDVISQVKMADDRMHEDYSAWLQILREVPYAYGINEPLLIYRLSKNSKSSNRIKSAKMIYASYRHVGYGAATAALFMIRYSIFSITKRFMIKAM